MSSQFADWLNEVARKWQEAWEKAGAFNADPRDGRRKLFVTAAFPYTNQPLDFYYARLFVTADVYSRLARAQGYNVLFPFAFQYTGTPIISVGQRHKEGRQRGNREAGEAVRRQPGRCQKAL